MNIPTPADSVMEMARKIGFETWKARAVGWRKANNVEIDPMWIEANEGCFRGGRYDDEDSVQSALAAIRATTEAAAAYCDTYEDWCAGWGLTRNFSAASAGAKECATALRANHHIKGSDDE